MYTSNGQSNTALPDHITGVIISQLYIRDSFFSINPEIIDNLGGNIELCGRPKLYPDEPGGCA